jgi:predicted amidohydrolase YtcJ
MRYSVSIWAAPTGDGIPNDLKKYAMPANTNPDFYRFVGIKAWIDGENDCRTGFMYEKYLGKQDIDPPGGHGHLVTPQAKANQIANIAKKNNKISMLHCSGDAAVDIGLKAYEQSLKTSARPIQRIEHFGVFQLNNSQLERAKKLKKNNFHFSVQPIWLLELVKADYENMGVERSKTGFKFHTMIQSGLEPAASTDMTGIYLENINPFKGMYAAVTRQSDVGLFEPQEAISVDDALKMWTIWPARAMGEGDEKGTITVGKFGDLTVLSQNIFTIPKEKIKDLYVEQTIVGGKVAYKK